MKQKFRENMHEKESEGQNKDEEEDERREDRDGASVSIVSDALLRAGQHGKVFPSSSEHQFSTSTSISISRTPTSTTQKRRGLGREAAAQK